MPCLVSGIAAALSPSFVAQILHKNSSLEIDAFFVFMSESMYIPVPGKVVVARDIL